jgi:hypothetical protein
MLDERAFDFSERFVGQSRGEIAQTIGVQQTRLLRQFFGSGVRGAQAADEHFKVPPGLMRESLEAYHEIARRTIESGQDQLGVQRIRLRLVERALREWHDV